MQKLTALLFGEPDEGANARDDASTEAESPHGGSLACKPFEACEPFEVCKPFEENLQTDFGFHRSISADTTASLLAFSRCTSGASEDWPHMDSPSMYHHEAPAMGHWPRILPEEHEGEVIAIARDGSARFVPAAPSTSSEDCGDESPLESSLVLVHPDGRAFFVPRGDRIDWKAVNGAGGTLPQATEYHRCRAPTVTSGLVRPLKPLGDHTMPTMPPRRLRAPEGSVPRSPSLKRLTRNMFPDEDVQFYRRASPSSSLARALLAESLPAAHAPRTLSPLQDIKTADASPCASLPHSNSIWSLTRFPFEPEDGQLPSPSRARAQAPMPLEEDFCFFEPSADLYDPFDSVEAPSPEVMRSPSLRQLAKNLFEAEEARTAHQGALRLATAASVVVSRRSTERSWLSFFASWCLQ